jgi:hypothetical protein
MRRLRKLGRYLIACGLVVALAACAAAPPLTPIKKVQTVEELLTKLKKAFDAGTITEPDFYARELGYPLVGPLTYSPDTVFDTKRDQNLTLVEGELKNTIYQIQVTTGVSSDQQKFFYVGTTLHSGCFEFQQVLNIWGNANFKQVPDTALHRTGATNPPLFYEAIKQVGSVKQMAKVSIGSKDYCLHHFSVTEFFKETK